MLRRTSSQPTGPFCNISGDIERVRRYSGGMRHLTLSCAVFTALLTGAGLGHAAPDTQTFSLSDAKDLIPINVKADAVEYKGRKAVRLIDDTSKDGLAFLRDVDFQDGTIEMDVALKVTTPPDVRMPGYFGVAFRAQSDASHYELFYLRPGNSQAEDQAMRNHSVQYVSVPGFDWYKLRREWPWVYETYAELQMEAWMKLKIEVKGRTARLFLNGSEQPALIVDGLKGADLHGGIALWCDPGEEAYFSDVRISHSTPLLVKNGSDASGDWQVKLSADAGMFDGALQLRREGTKLTGTWSGAFGDNLPVSGSWRDGYIELSFDANWPDRPFGNGGMAKATLAGWVDGDAAGGRMSVAGRADGLWAASHRSAMETDPFIGKWTLDSSKSKAIDTMKVDPVGANRYSITFGPGAIDTIAADGTDQPGLRGTTLSVAIEAPDRWKVVRKDKGRKLLTGIWRLSEDGKTLNDEYTNETAKPPSTVTYVYERTAGNFGFPGMWENTNDKVNSSFQLDIQPYEDGGLSFSTRGDGREMRFDGKEYPHHGANLNADATSSGRRASERSLEIIDKIGGEVVVTNQLQLSPDLKTLTLTVHPDGQSHPNVLVFNRQ
jgi:hypothetical protein